MENMDKELTVPKWVLIVQPKIPQMPQNLSANLSAQAQKFNEKKASLGVGVGRVRASDDNMIIYCNHSAHPVY